MPKLGTGPHKESYAQDKKVVLKEVKRAYTESTRNLHFEASRPVYALDLAIILNAIGHYNEFSPDDVFIALNRTDPRARVWVAREGSVCLYIQPTERKLIPDLRWILGKMHVDEFHVQNGVIRAWWD